MHLHLSLTTWLTRMILLLLLVPLTQAQPGPETKLTPSDPHAGQEFGAAVAIKGSVAVVGAFRDDPDFGVSEYGAAYVFGYDGDEWIELAKLTDQEPAAFDWFGWSVAVTQISFDTWWVFVGTRDDELVSQNAGALEYAQCRGALVVALACTMEATLFASDGEGGDHFGRALAADGNILIAGAALHDLTGFDEGAAYVYRFDGTEWVEEQKLIASDPANSAYFGESVAISGERVLIGAWGDSPPTVGNSGAAYVFEYDGTQWVETAKLTALDAAPQAQFGLTVALDGNRALIGAPLDNELGSGAGAAYLFHYDGNEWDEGAKILDPDHTGFNLFGSAVALDESRALIGADNWFPPGGNSTGKANFIDTFTYTTVVASDGGTGDNFGEAVAMDEGVLLIGASDHVHAGGTGAAYIYGEPTPTSVEDTAPSTSVLLSVPAPNPFWQQTHLTLMLSESEPVTVVVYDLLGRRVAVLHEGPVAADAPLDLTWDAADAAPGLYLVRVLTPSFVESRRVVLQR